MGEILKVVAFNGSPRPEGNTAGLIKHVIGRLEEAGISCELVQLAGKIKRGCTGCYKCRESKSGRCVFNDDIVNDCIAKMIEADGIIIGSPTYFASLSAETKALIDRAGFAARSKGNILKGKVGAAVVAMRRAGAINVFGSINAFFLINEMIVPGACYWNLGLGRSPGEVEKDEEGIRTMETLGENMAWLLKKIKA
ncbi:MAG TPA: flavodoxin family protein [Firmicutes bacterium]|nr:flavodoxin family protein [Bacillota bacterium]